MFIDGIVFHVTVSSGIKFCTIEDAPNESVKGALESFKVAAKLHNKRELRVATALGENEFDPLKAILEEKCVVNFNPVGANEHVAEVERMTQVVKERESEPVQVDCPGKKQHLNQ